MIGYCALHMELAAAFCGKLVVFYIVFKFNKIVGFVKNLLLPPKNCQKKLFSQVEIL